MYKPASTSIQAAPPSPPSYIKANSQFSPRSRRCCQCSRGSHEIRSTETHLQCCGHEYCRDCPQLDGSGNEVIPHSFPVDWVCSTCGNTHSVSEILTMSVTCSCESPTLQAVYDQFGRIFLYWRNDPNVHDLRDPAKVQEAAWRIWEAGSVPWLPVVVEAEKRAAAAAKNEMPVLGRLAKWNRFSSSPSISSEDSLDIEMADIAQ
ncbi:hypothetical protein B0H66DRAFT_249969 [Apodospora peruviana]|uniref:Uncharacterized protein n=1 Tax=Apodospora peruviana TaxID=516989 RepID=A0AAE0I561_9PEZI|nr:hypothetical protein B0H66DRAFT_249969 [Apodospora peruviana]